jgi:hypothetical protein
MRPKSTLRRLNSRSEMVESVIPESAQGGYPESSESSI